MSFSFKAPFCSASGVDCAEAIHVFREAQLCGDGEGGAHLTGAFVVYASQAALDAGKEELGVVRFSIPFPLDDVAAALLAHVKAQPGLDKAELVPAKKPEH